MSKKFRIYLPEGYASGEQRFPVIYQLHGWGATEDSWSSEALNLQEAADALGLQAMIVMPDGDRSMYLNSQAAPGHDACMQGKPPMPNAGEPRADFCVRHAHYEDFIISDLIPHIDGSYRTIPDRVARGVSGESMGGYGAMQLALRRDIFTSVVSHSGLLSLLYDGPYPFEPGKSKTLTEIVPIPGREEVEAILGYSIEYWREHDPYSLVGSKAPGDVAIYFDVGTKDEAGAYEMSQHFHERLSELGKSHSFVSVEGGHHDDELFGARASHGLKFHVERFKSLGVYPEGPSK